MGIRPTDEQLDIIDKARTKQNVLVIAGAGAAKTTSCELAARSIKRNGLYVAYNRAIVKDAEARFPESCKCKTSHGLAFYEMVIKRDWARKRLNDSQRVPARTVANILGISSQTFGDVTYSHTLIARLVGEAIIRFQNSADEKPSKKHVPYVDGMKHFDQIAAVVASHLDDAWADLNSPDGRLFFSHDTYLKQWVLTEPRLRGYEYIFVDEAQDANALLIQLVDRQRHLQKIIVGDRNQQIYEWRGAVNAMSHFDVEHTATLSKSFRFGQAIADEANAWLELLEDDLRLTGYEEIDSKVAPVLSPVTVLHRTNAGIILRAMGEQRRERRVAIVGGAGKIKSLSIAAGQLMSGQRPELPELAGFEDWDEAREYAKTDAAGSDLRVLVNAVDMYGTGAIIKMADLTVDENARPDIILSTVHKAKGREWETVQIADDFPKPRPAPQAHIDETGEEVVLPGPSEQRLAYVAVTRAKKVLDNRGLAWVHDPEGTAAQFARAA